MDALRDLAFSAALGDDTQTYVIIKKQYNSVNNQNKLL